MLYNSVVQRDETGLDRIYKAAKSFEEENVMEAIIACNFNMRKVERVLNYVRMYQNNLNLESSELVEFSEHFIEQYSTDNNKCFEIALGLVKKIGRTITGSMKLFRQFCPIVRRQLDKRNNVVPVLDYTKLSQRLYFSDFFGSEPYEDTVKTLLHEISAFFYHLVTTMKVCKDMIAKEKAVRGNYELLKKIFEQSCNEVLKSVNDVTATFKDVKLVTEEELEEHRKNARPLSEWLAQEYHEHDKKWLRKKAYILRSIEGEKYGLDPTASQFWPDNPTKGVEVIDAIAHLDELGLQFKKTKTSGKVGKFTALEMVYLLKWSGVSSVDKDGKIVNEAKEKQFYLYMQTIYKGRYEFPSWAAVCRDRAFCYNKMTLDEMTNSFAAHLQKKDAA